MYNLTNDSEDDNEVNAPGTVTKNPTSTTDPNMKPEVKEAKEKPSENSNPKEKRKSVGTYEGNGRYYSLFANENFLTEDTSSKKKKCCRVGIKSAFIISTVILLIFAIMALMWVVRGMQVEQNSMKLRIEKLEDTSAVMTISTLNHPSMQQAAVHPSHHQDSPCCNTNKEQIEYLDEVLKGHESRFKNVEEKLQSYRSTGDVRDAQISRNIAQNAADITSVRSKFKTVHNELSKAQKVADAAKSLALFTTNKGATLTEDEIHQYFGDLQGTSREGAAFAMAHASSRDITGDPADDVSFDYDQNSPPPPPSIVYDISSELTPLITFKENLIDEAGDSAYTQPESGTVTIQEPGRYFLSVAFCVHSHEETTVLILRNNVAVREFTVAGNNLGDTPPAVEVSFNPPPGFEYLTDENVMATPPMPPPVYSDAGAPVVRPYQFSDVVSLDLNDELQLKISKGTLAEYTYIPNTFAAKSCTRFLGFRL